MKKIIIIILTIFNAGCWSIYYLLFGRNNLPYKSNNINKVEINFSILAEVKYTNSDILYKVDMLFNSPKYSLNYKCFNDKNTKGVCNILLRKITLHESLKTIDSAEEQFELVFAFAHELSHLTQFCANERFSNYNTWIVLYESNDEYLRECAKYSLYLDIISPISEYSFAGYAEEYLKGERGEKELYKSFK